MVKDKIKRKIFSWLGVSKEDFVTRREFDKVDRLVNTHQDYLNNIYAFHKLEPNDYLAAMQELCYEFMLFFDNVCKKHNIEYWMDYGTLLGSYRHEGLIPWDDDLDVGMMREDYIRFIDVIQDELDACGLDHVKADLKIDKHNLKSVRWYQISYYYPIFKGKFIGLDIYPYEYLKDYDGRDLENDYMVFSKEYYHNPDDHDLEETVYEFYEKFNCTLQRDTHIIPGVEDSRNNLRKFSVYKFDVVETDQIFPLIRLPFGPYEFLAPNDTRQYLIDIYGKRYMQIPKKVRDHGRLNRYRSAENIMDILEECIGLLKKANERY
ncbi:phosphorylcholine transferase LicD [Methanobrevibacter sp.]|uniref:LicD family protein n=1 Tax=Methanobrevibacter sp. TaxID=66852 RepID=UPI0025D18156|nr:LicD family protein [Methanobrevibacter sp.]MBR4448491.1 LicD family protein [Methanobrevibacter sp.]